MGSKLADLPRLKINIFEAISSRPGVSSCKLWSLYRNGLRLFLLGSLPKCELDAIVCYTLGKENVHLHNELVQALLQKATAPKVPLLAKVAGYVDSAIKTQESRRLGGSPGPGDDGEEDEESDEESEGSRREGLRCYEELRRRLARGGAVWDVHQYMNLVPPSSWSPRLPEDPASLAASIARAKASRAAASASRPGPVVGGSSAMLEGPAAEQEAGGLKRKAPAELPGGAGAHPSQMRRLGDAAALGSPGGLHQVKQEGGGMEAAGAAPSSSSSDCSGLPPACLPSLQLVHHALRSAWHKQQQDLPPAPVEGQQPPPQQQVVSMQATLLLNEAVKDFTRRVLRRCMHVAKAERSRAAASASAAGGEAARGGTAGGGGGATGPSGAAPPQQASVSVSSTLMIGPSTVLRALKVPSADQRDPIGRSFPGPGLLEDMFCLSFY